MKHYISNILIFSTLLIAINLQGQRYLEIEDIEYIANNCKTYKELKSIEDFLNNKGFMLSNRDNQSQNVFFSDHNIFTNKYFDTLDFVDYREMFSEKHVFKPKDISYKFEYRIKNAPAELLIRYKRAVTENYFRFYSKDVDWYSKNGIWWLELHNKDNKRAKYGTLTIEGTYITQEFFVPNFINKNKVIIASFTRAPIDIIINRGDTIYLRAKGKIKLGAWAGYTDPNGIDGYESYSIDTRFKHGSLLLQLGGNYYSVGSSAKIISPGSFRLRFFINDSDISNNDGTFEIEYSINKPLPNWNQTDEMLTSPSYNNAKIEEVIKPETQGNQRVEIQKTTIDNNPRLILEDFFADNRNNWAGASDKHIVFIENNRLLYENNEKRENVYTMAGIPISLKGNDDYIVEVSIQSLTPCQNQQLDHLISLVSKKPRPAFYGFAIGDQQNDILFAVGSDLDVREGRDYATYTCKPSYFITSLIGGNSSFLQDWTKSNYVLAGSSVNILKLIKKDGTFNFYVNNRLISTKNAYSLGNDNAIAIVTSAKSKIAVNYVKIYKY